MSADKAELTTKENSSNYFAFVGLSFFSGSVAMTIGGGLSGNPLLIAAAGMGALSTGLMVASKLPYLKKHEAAMQRVAFGLNLTSAVGFLPAAWGAASGFDPSLFLQGCVTIVANAVGTFKANPDPLQPTTNLTDIALVRPCDGLGLWWQQLPPARLTGFLFLPAGLMPISGLLEQDMPALYQWAATTFFTAGNIALSLSHMPSAPKANASAPKLG
jgi:hypothetical protein